MYKNYTGLLYILSVARFCTNAPCFDGHSRSVSHKNQSAVLLKAIISGTVRFLPMAIPCTLTYPSRNNLPLISPDLPLGPRNLPLKTLRQRKVKLYQFRSFDFDFFVLVQILGKGGGILFAKVMGDTTDGQIHFT